MKRHCRVSFLKDMVLLCLAMKREGIRHQSVQPAAKAPRQYSV